MKGYLRLGQAALIAVLASILIPSAAGAVDVNWTNPAGPNARRIVELYTVIFWVAMFVLVVVGGLIVYAALRFRRRSDDDQPEQIHGNSRLELAWTVFPLVVLLVLFSLTFGNMDYIRNGPPAQMTVKVVASRFAWLYQYPGGVRTDVLRIPVGTVVRLEVTSVDVLHSFWAPRLGGQIYANPAYPNHGWLQADRRGTYYGQCNELCGIGHADMMVTVMALSQSEFDTWYNTALKSVK
jgi:cytochrome c oxidase subunit 2